MYAISCNRCGKLVEIPKEATQTQLSQLNTLHIIPLKFQYGSKFDTLKTQIVLCDDCIETLLSSCVVPVVWIEQV